MIFDVAVVGGGFSGTMLAAQLARRGIASALIDGSGRIGRGIAYSTREPAHVLNVFAEVMGAWPEDPEEFAPAVERGIAETGRPTIVDVVVTRDPARMLPGVDSRTAPVVKKGDRIA